MLLRILENACPAFQLIGNIFQLVAQEVKLSLQNYFEENEDKKAYWKIRESKPKKSNIWTLSCTTDGDLRTLCIFKSPHNITWEREEGAITNDVFKFKKLSTLKADVRAVWKPVSWFAVLISWLFFQIGDVYYQGFLSRLYNMIFCWLGTFY